MAAKKPAKPKVDPMEKLQLQVEHLAARMGVDLGSVKTPAEQEYDAKMAEHEDGDDEE